jgi:hypothetical protein
MNRSGKTLAILFAVVVSIGLVTSGTSFILPAFAVGSGGSSCIMDPTGHDVCGGGGGGCGQGGCGGGGAGRGYAQECTVSGCQTQDLHGGTGGGCGQGGCGSGGSGTICTGPNKDASLPITNG